MDTLRDGAVAAIAVIAAITMLYLAGSYALNHQTSAEDTGTSALVARKVESEVESALACQGAGTFAVGTQTWKADGTTVTASAANGEVDVSAAIGKRTFPLAAPLWTSCKQSGATITVATP